MSSHQEPYHDATHLDLPQDKDRDDPSSKYSPTHPTSHRDGNISPNGAVYDKDAALPDPIAQYAIYSMSTGANLQIVQGANEPTTKEDQSHDDADFFVNTRTMVPGAPDLKLFAGPSEDDDGKVLGIVRFLVKSGGVRIGFGDGVNERGMRWVDVKRHGVFVGRRYEFVWSPLNGTDVTFAWRRTHEKKLGASATSLSDKKLVDEATGEVVAVYLSNRSMSGKKVGRLMVYKEYGGEWKMMVLLSFLGLLENDRRGRNGRFTTGGAGVNSLAGGPGFGGAGLWMA
jgi:hypothetical protein